MTWIDQSLAARGQVSHVEQVLDDLSAALSLEDPTLGPALLVARTADLTRSSFFLCLEASLQAQERLCRIGMGRLSAPQWLPRALVLAALTADLYLGYAALRLRARRIPELVRPRDCGLQHQRGARRLLDTATSLGGTLVKAGQLASVRGDLLPED